MEALAGLSGGIEIISSIIYKINSLIVAITMLMGGVSVPSTDTRISYAESDAKLMAVVWGDTQLCNYNPEREVNFVAACDDLQNSSTQIDALLVAGDIVENGFQSEYDSLTDDLVKVTKVDNFVMCAGNHDIRIRDYEQSTQRYFDFTNNLNPKDKAIDNIWFEYEVDGGYSFLVIGSDEMRFEDAYLSDAQLEWLEERVAAISASGKPVFVMGHYPLRDTHGLPLTWGSSLWESGTIGDQSDIVYELLNKYDNVFYLTGHLHTGIGQYTYEEIGNIHGINVPSIGITNKDGDYNNATGVILEVYEDKVISRARDFGTGEYIPEYTVTYELV